MSVKHYNTQDFNASVNGTDYNFSAYTTNTRNGFCHTIVTRINGYRQDGTTKVSYINRTWERFDYETALKGAIKKCAKADREQLTAILIDKTAKAEEERCNAFIEGFKAIHDKLTDENKERLANVVGTIETEEQAQAAKGIAAMMAIMQ